MLPSNSTFEYQLYVLHTQVVLRLQRLSKLTKLGSAYGSKSSHQTTAQAAAASQRVTQDEGEQQVSY